MGLFFGFIFVIQMPFIVIGFLANFIRYGIQIGWDTCHDFMKWVIED